MKLNRIRNIINDISESVDKDTALKNENAFYSILLSAVVFVGAIAHFCVQYLIFDASFTSVIRGSIILTLFGIVSIAISLLNKEVFKMYLYSFEVSLLYLFVYYEFISFIGPIVVLVGLLFLFTMLVYSRIDIILIYFTSFLLVIMTSDVKFSTYENWESYFVAQFVVLIMILVAVIFVYRVYRGRKDKIERQYAEILLSEEKLENLSYCDYLTGLYNRRFFEKKLLVVDKKNNLPISFVFADVNGLKQINDTFGHAAGDELIKIVASNIKDTCRDKDVVARVGGDEFIIILPKTNTIDANQIVSRIIKKIEKEEIMNMNISVSFGVATKENDYEKIFDIITKAEDIMYIEKGKHNARIRKSYES